MRKNAFVVLLTLAACHRHSNDDARAVTPSTTAAPPAVTVAVPPASMPIPSAPVAGSVRGEGLVTPHVDIVENGHWSFKVQAASYGAAVTVQNLTFDGTGVITKTKGDRDITCDAFSPSNKQKKRPQSLDAITSNCSYWIDITKWDVPPYDAQKGGVQHVGRVSGKVYVQIASEGDSDYAQAAGEFDDAEVTYWQDPAKKS
jgi:hypothetical protein